MGVIRPYRISNRIEEIMLLIFHRDAIYPISFVPEDCVALCETVKSSLNIPHFGRLFHPQKVFPPIKKKKK